MTLHDKQDLMDSSNFPYPCKDCKMYDSECTHPCGKWREWFPEKWQETVVSVRREYNRIEREKRRKKKQQ